MKIAVLGGGGFRVPMVYGALLERSGRLGVEEVALFDVDGPRLARIAPVLAGLERERGERLAARPTTDLDDALEGADFVFCAIRVGRLEGRVVDERVPLDEGVVGQETTGPAGLCFALRTVPVMVELAEAVAERAPHAWFVNFTNPAGLVTEAIQEVLGDRAIGICDSPAGLCRRVAEALGRDPAELWFDYFGINHLGWLRGVYDGDRDVLPELLADDERLSGFEEGRLFGGDWLRTLGMIPNEYLYFYYHAADTVAALRSGLESRAEFLVRQQAGFYRDDGRSPEDALAVWRATRREREQTYFAEARAAAGVARATRRAGGRRLRARGDRGRRGDRRNECRVLILDTANRSACRSSTSAPSSRCRASSAGRGAIRPRSARCPSMPARSSRRSRTVERRRSAPRSTLARARPQGDRAAPARAVGQRRAPDPRRVRRAPPSSREAPRVSAYDVVCAGPPFLDLTFVGLERLPAR